MAAGRSMISTEYRGTTEGNTFDDSSIMKDLTNAALTRIIVYHHNFIHSLTMHYTDCHTPVQRGGISGTRAEIVLRPGEFITRIEGVFETNVIATLKFKTNKGVIFGPYGKKDVIPSQVPFVWNGVDNAPPGLAHRMGLLYFSGNACSYVRQLRATFALYPGGVESYKNLKCEKRVYLEPAACGVALSSFARNMMSPVVSILVGPDAFVFHACEATLCRIPFFRAALQGEFKEAVEKKITMPEEKPEIFSALIEHLYTGNYTYTYESDHTTETEDIPTPDLAQGCFHVSVYAVAFRYDWPPLVSDAMSNFRSVISQLAGMDIVRLWKAAYENGLTLPSCAEEGHLAEFERVLPKLLKGLYKTNSEEMESTVSDFPALANDFMRLLVAGSED